jgi:putative flippase GtrA
MKGLIQLYIRGTPVAILSTLSDIVSMYVMKHYTLLDTNYIIYISSIINISVAFIGHILWTFKYNHSNKSKLQILLKYIVIQVILLICVSELSIRTIHMIDTYINTTNISRPIFIHRVEGKPKLTNISHIMIKQLYFLIFFFINIYLLKFIF